MERLFKALKAHKDFHSVIKTKSGIAFTYKSKHLEIRKKNDKLVVYSGNYPLHTLKAKQDSLRNVTKELDYVVNNLGSIKENFDSWKDV